MIFPFDLSLGSSSQSLNWLAILAECSIKGVVILALAGLMSVALRRVSAAFRHAIWAGALVALVALPVFSGLLPGWNIGLLPSISTPWSSWVGRREGPGVRCCGSLGALTCWRTTRERRANAGDTERFYSVAGADDWSDSFQAGTASLCSTPCWAARVVYVGSADLGSWGTVSPRFARDRLAAGSVDQAASETDP